MSLRLAYLFSELANRYLYHVTEYANLERVASEGLKPGTWSRRKPTLFLTEAGGVVYWFKWVGIEAEHRVPGFQDKVREFNELYGDSDELPDITPYDIPEIQPVLLRTPLITEKVLDKTGTKDAAHEMLHKLHLYLPEAKKKGLPPERSWPPSEIKTEKAWKAWERQYAKVVKELGQTAKAWQLAHGVEVKDLEVYDGASWIPLRQWRQVKVPYDFSALLDSITESVNLDPVTLKRSAATESVPTGQLRAKILRLIQRSGCRLEGNLATVGEILPPPGKAFQSGELHYLWFDREQEASLRDHYQRILMYLESLGTCNDWPDCPTCRDVQTRRAAVRCADKMDAVDLAALKRTPKAWQRLMRRFPETLVRELMVERPRPDYRDVEEVSDWQLSSPGPVEVELATLLKDPENQRSVRHAPPDVVEEINALWGTSIAAGPQLDLNPGRYRAYAELPRSSAKPSVLVDGVVLFGVARFVAALLRGDRTLKVWDLRTVNPVSSRNHKGRTAVKHCGRIYPTRKTVAMKYRDTNDNWAGTAAAEIRRRIKSLPAYASAIQAVLDVAFRAVQGKSVAELRALGGFTAVLTAALEDLAATDPALTEERGSVMFSGSIYSVLKQDLPALREELQTLVVRAADAHRSV